MTHRLTVVLALVAASCAREFEGPAPEVGAVSPGVVCAVQLDSPLTISGARFSPHPAGLLTNDEHVVLPEVSLVSPAGRTALPQATFSSTSSLGALFPRDRFQPGPYDVVVRNPNGFEGRKAGALTVVPPPGLASVEPASGVNTAPTAIAIAGTGFRADGDAQPVATLTPAGGGTAIELDGESVESATSLVASVPAGLTPGRYDLTVKNPEGCTDTLANAFEVLEPPRLDLVSVTPAFGWIGSRTTLQVTASNENGRGLAPVPELFLLVDPDGDGEGIVEVPLIREAYLSRGSTVAPFTQPSVVTAVVPSSAETRGAGLAVGGPYDLKVVNPDGAIGLLEDAFTVLADAPPVIARVSPEQAEKSATVTLTLDGSNFKDPITTETPRIARVLLLTQNLASGAACVAPSCHECASPVRTTAGASSTITCSPPLAAMAAGAYVVRVEHLDDGSFGDYASFAVTNPSGNLASATTPLPALNAARMAHGSAFARDDLGNRFVYAIGGRSGSSAASRLDTVEVMPLPLFSAPSAWTALPVKLPKAMDGLAVVAHGPYLFAVGGRDVDGTVLADVYRARVLGSDTAPVIGEPAAQAGGTLAGGTWYYRVAAVMADTTDNANGESLPSDGESVRVAEGSSVRLSWQNVEGAVSYRIYRSAGPNELAGSEGFLASTTETSFTDDGSKAVDAAQVPRPIGSTGTWMAMTSLPEGRVDAAVAIGVASGENVPYLFVLGGRSPAGAAQASVYSAAIVTASGVSSIGDFRLAAAMPVARAEFAAAAISTKTAPTLAGKNDAQYLVASNGITDTGTTNAQIHAVKIDDGGLLAGGWTLAASGSQYKRFGHVAVLTNDFFFTIGGRENSILTKGQTAVVACVAAPCDPPPMTIQGGDSGVTLSTGRYRASVIYDSALFYFVGGSSDGTTALATAERGGYAN